MVAKGSRGRIVLAGLAGCVLFALTFGAGLAVWIHWEDEYDRQQVQKTIDAMAELPVPGSVRSTPVTVTWCKSNSWSLHEDPEPGTQRTDWSALPPATVKARLARQVLASGWHVSKYDDREYAPDDMSGAILTITAWPWANGGSKVAVKIDAGCSVRD